MVPVVTSRRQRSSCSTAEPRMGPLFPLRFRHSAGEQFQKNRVKLLLLIGRNYEDVCDTIREFVRRGVVIRTDALIAFMAATSQAQAEATKAAQRTDIEHAKQSGDRAYIGRKPSFTREQFVKVRAMLGQQAVGTAQIARETGLTRQTVYRIKGDPAGAQGALVVWGM
jgi:putative DNA-invertase from lambdoid prophage Rac